MKESLDKLESLIAHAKQIEREIEAVARSLKMRQINSGAYQISPSLAVNEKHFKEIFADCDDVQFREVNIGLSNQKALLIYIEDMADQDIINQHLIEKLTACRPEAASLQDGRVQIAELARTVLSAALVNEEIMMEQAVKRILDGDAALIIDGADTLLVAATRKVANRAISEPSTEPDIRGPRDSFIEDLRINLTLIRRRINNPNLVIKKKSIGRRSRTSVALLYIKSIVNFKLVLEAERRLDKINVDDPEVLTLQRLIEDTPNSPFPTIQSTERPDKFTAGLLRGKVGIIVDGTPFALLAPAVFSDFFQAGDDFFEKWIPETVTRLMRYVAAFFALTVPALYVAVTSFHPALIPTPLALTIGVSREGVPFPAFLEALIMIFFLEVMHEAGVRMPKNIGQAVSIVGGLVIGDASVRAGLVSSPLVIITSFTAIATFSIASYSMALAVRFLRVPLMVLGSSFGMYGVVMGLLLILSHLCTLESFGESYLAQLAPKTVARMDDFTDAVIVTPPSSAEYRFLYLEPEDIRSQQTDGRKDQT